MSSKNKTKINISNLTSKELAEYNRLLHENKIFEIKNDRNLFTEYILRDRISKKKVKQSKIHIAMQYAFENYKKVLVVVPRNSGKTNQSLAAILYEIGKNNDIIVKIVSDGDNTASKRVNAIKQHLEHNTDFLELYPNIKPLTLGNRSLARENWGKTSLTINRKIIDLNSTCSASSITTQGVGDRADLLVFDDPCNLRNSILMPALREQVIDAYYSVWLPLLNESGRIWYFGTPYSSDDLTSLLRENWKGEQDCCILDFHLGQEIEIDQEGKVIKVTETGDDTRPIWPENFSKEFYMSAKRTMTDKSYARAYLCKAISDSDVFFKMSHVQACLDYSFSLLENINELEVV